VGGECCETIRRCPPTDAVELSAHPFRSVPLYSLAVLRSSGMWDLAAVDPVADGPTADAKVVRQLLGPEEVPELGQDGEDEVEPAPALAGLSMSRAGATAS